MLLNHAQPHARASLAIMVQIARLYHEQGMSQPAIAQRLHISQSRVSRLLRAAVEQGIVRTVVATPDGVYPELEETIRAAYGLTSVLLVDCADNERSIYSALGGAAAAYLETSLTGKDIIGLSSWSSTLLSSVESMMPLKKKRADKVVQILGGLGESEAQLQSSRLTEQLALMTGAKAVYMPTPGLVSSRDLQRGLMQDPVVAETASEWQRLTVLLTGIGSLDPSPLLARSGNSLGQADIDLLKAHGAVGDIAMRFFAEDGRLIESDLYDRVLGIGVKEMLSIPRRVGVAGGRGKFEAIRAAVRGGWIDVLVTDIFTGRRLALAEG
ncbi:sugar-binding domain-containing protein [Pseudarthrobacter oxydans]